MHTSTHSLTRGMAWQLLGSLSSPACHDAAARCAGCLQPAGASNDCNDGSHAGGACWRCPPPHQPPGQEPPPSLTPHWAAAAAGSSPPVAPGPAAAAAAAAASPPLDAPAPALCICMAHRGGGARTVTCAYTFKPLNLGPGASVHVCGLLAQPSKSPAAVPHHTAQIWTGTAACKRACAPGRMHAGMACAPA